MKCKYMYCMLVHPLISLLLSFLSFTFPNIYIYMMNHLFLWLWFFYIQYLLNNCVLCFKHRQWGGHDRHTQTHTRRSSGERVIIEFHCTIFYYSLVFTIYVCTDVLHYFFCYESCYFFKISLCFVGQIMLF